MDVISYAIKDTNMPAKYDAIFKELLREYVDKDISMKSGDLLDLKDKVEATYNDLNAMGIDDELLYRDLFYHEMKRFSVKRPDIVEINSRIISKTFFNKDFREKVKALPKWESGYISYMKSIIPKLEILLGYLGEEKSYGAMKSYKDLLDFLNIEALDPKMKETKKQEELNKRYHIPGNTLDAYYRRIKKIEYKPEQIWEKTVYTQAYNYSNVCSMLQKYLYNIMIEYYNKTGCFFKQYNEDVSLYYFGKLTIITYKYDDNPGMSLRTKDGIYTWQSKEFWKIISDPSFAFSNSNIQDNSFSLNIKSHLSGDVISTPEEYMNEAFLRKVSGNDNMDIDLFTEEYLRKIGFPNEVPTEKLLTTNDSFYFKNPLKFNELKVKKPSLFDTLSKIMARNPKERLPYLKWLREHDKDEKPSLSSKVEYSDIPKKEFTPRLPYKD
jgi:hypothetical protein